MITQVTRDGAGSAESAPQGAECDTRVVQVRRGCVVEQVAVREVLDRVSPRVAPEIEDL